MRPLSIKEIVTVTKGRAIACNPADTIRGVSTDTRTIKRGSLFVALKGKKRNGHAYVRDAFKKGTVCALVSKRIPINKPQILVRDTLYALGDIALYYREHFDTTVIGITGSNGKTTTKQMLTHLLKIRYQTIASPASFNNFLGVPLAIFMMTKRTRFLIQEMETNILGGITRLCDIAQPSVAVITNISPTHLDTLKTVGGVFREKSELLTSLPKNGLAVLNADDAYCTKLKKKASGRKVITFGIRDKSTFKARDITRRRNRLYFTINGVRFSLCTLFYKNIYNALAAVSVASRIYGISLSKAAKRLASFRFPKQRFEITNIKGITVINDCFNANPESTKDALNALSVCDGKRKLALLGDMYELGRRSKALHREVGRAAGRARLAALACVGKSARYIASGAKKAKMPSAKITYCKTHKDAVKFLSTILLAGDTLLVKASRRMKLENVIEQLKHKMIRR